MNRGRMNRKKGFTLVELIVVLVILAILAAIMVPALLGWIDKARDQDAILECRAVVVATQGQVAEEYAKAGENEPNTKNVLQTKMNSDDVKEAVLKLAGLAGEIGRSSIILNSSFAVTDLKYKTEKGIMVIYDISHNPVYRIREKGKYSDDVPGYVDRVDDLDEKQTSPDHFLDSDENIKEGFEEFFGNKWDVKNNTSRRVQAAYIEEYGSFPKVDWDRVPMPPDVTIQNNGAGAVWKPIVTENGEIILTADTKNIAGNSLAFVVYYNGQYYYHRHSPEQPKKATPGTVNDKNFSLEEDLFNNPEWVGIEK